VWDQLRVEITRTIAGLLERMPDGALHDHFLFTIVAAAATRTESAVWAIGDGVYQLGATRTLGPFADNQPPYLAYDLTGDVSPAHLEVAPACDVVIATDGLDDPAPFASARFVTHPDALRRELAVRARSGERIDWDARRIDRTPAQLQDDGAVGVILR
jgi:hypothetical protein